MSTEPDVAQLRRGTTDRRVTGLRERLLRAGTDDPSVHPDTVSDPSHFDSALDAALRAFQQKKGLIVDGVLGPETEIALTRAQYTLGDRTLSYDPDHLMRGDDVERLQANLSRLGFYYGHLNGVFNQKTHYAVEELQQSLGLTANGVVDLETIAALARINKNITSSKAYSLRDYHRLEQAAHALHQRIVVLLPWASSGQVTSPDAPGDFVQEQDEITRDVALRTYELLDNIGAHPLLVGNAPATTRHGRPLRCASTFDSAVEGLHDAIVISLHCDWNSSSAAQGVATYFWGDYSTSETYSPIGELAARYVLKELVSRTGAQDLGCHARQWSLLRRSELPTVWVDLGYLSNPSDRASLADPDHRERLAEALLCGLQRMYVSSEQPVATGTMSVSDIEAYYKNQDEQRTT